MYITSKKPQLHYCCTDMSGKLLKQDVNLFPSWGDKETTGVSGWSNGGIWESWPNGQNFYVTTWCHFFCPVVLVYNRSELIQSKNFYHPFSVRGTLALPYAKSSHCYLDWISCQFLFFIWPSEPTYTHSTNWEVYGVRSRTLFLYPFQCTKM